MEEEAHASFEKETSSGEEMNWQKWESSNLSCHFCFASHVFSLLKFYLQAYFTRRVDRFDKQTETYFYKPGF
ncbi:hypothetical protein T08_9997 [Trichinella sp. T8]|uniref:Uncharacterized protein n=1 Tax=Trichinella murrelli TaxID=144512 RepID=A0A0V0U698_9BILA|nr:hypothetical protein T05_15109 [Trichinella murrelli]KRZ85977.1 hypothetical protein T08_9997 [Trichinella sp. T8]